MQINIVYGTALAEEREAHAADGIPQHPGTTYPWQSRLHEHFGRLRDVVDHSHRYESSVGVCKT